MISLAAIARLVNVLREVSPEGAQRAVTELYELQQAINRMEKNIAAIAAKLGIKDGPVISPERTLEVISSPSPAVTDDAGTTLQIPDAAE